MARRMLPPSSAGADDSLRVFLDQAGAHRLLDRAGETLLAQAIERGRTAGHALEQATDAAERARLERIVEDGAAGPSAFRRSKPASRRLGRAHLRRPRRRAAGPRAGRQRGPDACGRRLRVAARLQVLDVRGVVDPPGDPAGAFGARTSPPPLVERRRRSRRALGGCSTRSLRWSRSTRRAAPAMAPRVMRSAIWSRTRNPRSPSSRNEQRSVRCSTAC